MAIHTIRVLNERALSALAAFQTDFSSNTPDMSRVRVVRDLIPLAQLERIA